MLLLLYPAEYGAVLPFLWVGGVAQVIYFTAGTLSVILLRFAKRRYQIYINGAFAICFFGAGIPCTYLFGLWGFALAAVGANLLRWLIAIMLGWYTVIKDSKMEEQKRKIENQQKQNA